MAAGMTRVRLDELLVQRGHVTSREKARALVLAGQVSVAGIAHAKPGRLVSADIALAVAPSPTYVSRGGIKLAHALERFGVDPSGRVCADIGASTGGFTDCLLQRGARRVFAIDVGYGQLDWRLRNDPRVVVLDRTNARYIEGLPEVVSLITIDVSFISLRLVLPAARLISEPGADILTLVKPQFEAGRGLVGKGGVVRDPTVHRRVLESLWDWAPGAGFELLGLTASPIRGAAGNAEFLAHLRLGASGSRGPGPDGLIDLALTEAERSLGTPWSAPAPALDRR